jgi:hypothetical protein
MEKYNKVKLCFEENNCTLLTSFEEFEELRKTVRINYYQYVSVRFIGTCTHESSVVFTNFFLRKTGIKCRDCITQESKLRNIKNKVNNTNQIEYDGIKLVEEYLKRKYIVKRTKEGCLADIGIKKISETEDKWIPIQVKTTIKQSHGMYSFKQVIPSYKNMLLMCICNSENKIWIIPYNNLNVKSSLNISKKSKYSKYTADLEHIDQSIDRYVNDIEYVTLDTLLSPITELQKREQIYVKKREEYIPFLDYSYPDVQSSVVDFMISGKKVQEKVLGYVDTKKMLSCSLASNNGKIDGKRTFRTYCLGENDYYWLHSSIDNRFWIIPEQILFEKGYIANTGEIKIKKNLQFKSENNINKEWINKYEYNYDNITEEIKIKIMELFKNIAILK